MQESAAGLRGGAFCGQREHLCRGRPALGLPIAARWRRTVRKERKKAVADEGVAQSPRPPHEAGAYRIRGACSRRTDVHVLVVAAPVPILVTRIQKSDLRRGQIMSAFLLSFCNGHMRAGNGQRGQRNLVDEALTKRSKCDDTIEQKVLLRRATQKSNGGVSWLMLAITWARSGRTCAPARWLELSDHMWPDCARARTSRSLLAARRRPERGSTCLCDEKDSLTARGDHWLSSHFGFETLSLGPRIVWKSNPFIRQVINGHQLIMESFPNPCLWPTYCLLRQSLPAHRVHALVLGRIPHSLWGRRTVCCMGEGDHSPASAALAAVVGARRCGTCPPAYLRH